MKSLRNTVTLIGRAGQNPEIINFDNGGSMAKFSLATTDTWKNQKGEKMEDTQWHNLVVRNGLVKVVEKYIEKGQEMCIEGRLTTRKWEDKEGKAHYITEIQVNDLLMLGGKK